MTPDDVFVLFDYTRHYLQKIVLGELKKQTTCARSRVDFTPATT